jgi:hypothetical protein
MDSTAFTAFVEAEIDRWTPMARSSALKVE